MRCRCCDIPLTEREENLRRVFLPTGEVVYTDACMCNRCWNTDQHDTIWEPKMGDHIPASFYRFDD
jgi:hypothetical protein